ncbi:four helix bundle protein [Limnoglobus roseus]|uniref:Four helix bundle protein n=1 Tax=Limnoglobus roseus TaxID=2598579 RepID=A0A5C1A7Z1_9BACT|nr:four helix bundle protein [Limnoglobus roseus]QEL14357.1 four helix bundle protein [Limnoglobus roseus]
MQNEAPNIVPRTFQFALRIVRLCSQLIESTGVARTIGYQLVKSGIAIGAIIEEVQASPDKPDFARGLTQALKEARLTNYWLRLLVESRVLPDQLLEPLVQESTEIMKVLGAITANTYRGLS